MLTGYWISQALYVAAKLGLADLLKDGPRTADDLARPTKTHPRSLYRLLRALEKRGQKMSTGSSTRLPDSD
jgi:sugar-specific transcriptional regulator TrmB